MQVSETIQWLICGALGAVALFFLLRRFGVLPLRKAGDAAAKGGACGACAHCEAAKPLQAGPVATDQLKRVQLPGPPR